MSDDKNQGNKAAPRGVITTERVDVGDRIPLEAANFGTAKAIIRLVPSDLGGKPTADPPAARPAGGTTTEEK